MMQRISTHFSWIFVVTISLGVFAQTQKAPSDAFTQSIIKVRTTLAKHYKVTMPGQHGLPPLPGRFVPIEFENCKLKWALVSKSGRLTFKTQTSLDLTDLDATPPLVLMSNMPQTDRWHFELKTLNGERKIKAEWIVIDGSKVKERREYWVDQSGFGADSQALTQEMADEVVSLIKQCAERRSQQSPSIVP